MQTPGPTMLPPTSDDHLDTVALPARPVAPAPRTAPDAAPNPLRDAVRRGRHWEQPLEAFPVVDPGEAAPLDAPPRRRRAAPWLIAVGVVAVLGAGAFLVRGAAPAAPAEAPAAPAFTPAAPTTAPEPAAPTATRAPADRKPTATRSPRTTRPAPVPSATRSAPAPEPRNDVLPGTSYANCAAAEEAGVTPILPGEPGYDPDLDEDGDGIACDE